MTPSSRDLPVFILCSILSFASPCFAAEVDAPWPQTQPLVWEEADLSARLMDGAHRFVERQIAESVAKRSEFRTRDFSSADAYSRSVEPNRKRFREIVGAADPRLPPRMGRFGDDTHPALVAEMPRYRVYQVRWPVLEGRSGEGLLVQPKASPLARVVVIPDASRTPEQLLGLAPREFHPKPKRDGAWARTDLKSSCQRPSTERN